MSAVCQCIAPGARVYSRYRHASHQLYNRSRGTARRAAAGTRCDDREPTAMNPQIDWQARAMQLEEELAKARRREQDLANFIEKASVGLIWVDAAGTILWANQAELDLLGYRRDEYVGKPVTRFHAAPAAIEDVLHRLQSHEPVRNHEARLRCKDGSFRDVVI